MLAVLILFHTIKVNDDYDVSLLYSIKFRLYTQRIRLRIRIPGREER